jgi:hypothetical protein
MRCINSGGIVVLARLFTTKVSFTGPAIAACSMSDRAINRRAAATVSPAVPAVKTSVSATAPHERSTV